MIETVGLTKVFGSRRALDDVTLRFPDGSVTALLGLNGAGKTTLLRLMAGLDQPDAGSVKVDAGSVGRPSVGLHLGPAAVNPRHTVRRHLRWVAALAGLGDNRVDEVLDATGLADHRDTRASALSLGFRQRLAIASTVLSSPRALLFDEPLNGLDVPGIVWLRGELRRLAEAGATVVIATHLLSEAVLTADRVAILDGGRQRLAGGITEVVPTGAEPRQWLESALLDCA